MAFAVVVPAAAFIVDCSEPAGGAADSSRCAQLGGVCQPLRPENFTCQNVNGHTYEYQGSVPGLCGSDPSLTCCVRLDADGGLPSQLGSDGICGGIVCAAGSVCLRGIDTESCGLACDKPPSGTTCASCGSITCNPGCTCLDAARNHCEC